MTKEEMITYDQIVGYEIATPEEINLVRCIVPGTWEEILNHIIYVRTGYRTFEQWLAEEMEEMEW